MDMEDNVGTLTSQDHGNLTALLEHTFLDYKANSLTLDQAVGTVAHVITALDLGNRDELRTWLEKGRKFGRQLTESNE